MSPALQILILWVGAFGTLCAAILLLNTCWATAGYDLCLRSAGSEAVIAGAASLIEAASVWAVATFVPQGSLGLLIPALVVAAIYRITHVEDWSRYEIICLLLFQVAISGTVALAVYGLFKRLL